jgi:hypothetical protein
MRIRIFNTGCIGMPVSYLPSAKKTSLKELRIAGLPETPAEAAEEEQAIRRHPGLALQRGQVYPAARLYSG